MEETTLTIAIIGLTLSALTIAAIMYGPIAALRIQRRLDEERESRSQNRKREEEIFRTLWVTRSTPVNLRHVEALNLIELDYEDSAQVLAAWNLYLDHLNTDASKPGWEDKRVDLLTDLLYEMARALGKTYDKVVLKRHWYRPTFHSTLDEMDMAMRKGFSSIMKGESALPVRIVGDEPPVPPPDTNALSRPPGK